MQFSLHHGDCLDLLRNLDGESIDSVVTDPPYGLSEHKPSDTTECLAAWISGKEYRPKKRGFMGHAWDAWVPGPEVWREVFRVLKPGGHIAVFAGTRSHDLMSIALRMAGFECRDTIMWVYGSGFPKSHDVSKAIDKMAGAEREVIGRKVSTYDGCNRDPDKHHTLQERCIDSHQWGYIGKSHAQMLTAPATSDAARWEGWGTALKPAFEPILLFRKPLIGTVAENVLMHGVGALNIDDGRVQTKDSLGGGDQSANIKKKGEGWDRPWMQDESAKAAHAERVNANVVKAEALGRWPANLIHDGSEDVVALFPHSNGQQGVTGKRKQGAVYGTVTGGEEGIEPRGDTGSAARFFYCSKASKSDRGPGNEHPTVKPIDLMTYVCRLITPPGGTILDNFCGSGSTGVGAILGGFNFVGLDLDEDEDGNSLGYLDVARSRCTLAQVERFDSELGSSELGSNEL